MIPVELIEKVLAQAQNAATHSWEYSTVFEALLEYHSPQYSIFHDPFPAQKVPSLRVEDVIALQYVKPFIRTDSTRLCEGNGSSSDPSSLGIPALLLSQSPSLPNPNPYREAVERQLHDLLTTTPRYPTNSAISHRSAYPSLWADFIYMTPPFLAYHGVFTKDLDMVRESVRQCECYRDVLRTEKGYWRHIANAEGVVGDVKEDEGGWCTSNAWAAAGMSRVLTTLRKATFAAAQTVEEQMSLVGMIKGILDGAKEADTDVSGLLRNYLDDESWFGEVAGTALMGATVFRMAVLEPGIFGGEYTDWASKKLEAVGRHVDVDTGVAAPIVNSLKEGQRTPLDGVNPEGQAFVVLMYAAWRDWESTNARIAS